MEGERLLRRIDDLAARLDEIETLPPEDRSSELTAQAEALRGRLAASRSSYADRLESARREDPRGAVMLGSAAVGERAVAAALRPDEALIEYLVTDDVVVTFVLTRDTLRYFRSAISRAVLASRVRVARSEVGDAPAAGDPPSAVARLHRTLIAPVERSGLLRPVTRLLIVPHAELTYLPFAALRRSDGAYLIESYVISHLPSATVLPVLRRPSRRVGLAVAGLAPFPRELPATVAEVRALAEAVPTSETWLADEANEPRLRAVLASHPVVHVATHGELNPINPMYSRLAVAPGSGAPEDDGRLEVHELLGLNVRSAIVYLSGCETGVGTEWSTSFSRGEDYTTLSRALLYAGAETVIATLWPVADASASRFAQLFYGGLSTLDVAEALARAQRGLIADQRFGAPYHWAAFRLSGRSDLQPTAQ